MKVSFILLGILSAVLTWFWYSPSATKTGGASGPRFLHRLTRSLIAGVAVYFVLMAIAMVWLLVTT